MSKLNANDRRAEIMRILKGRREIKMSNLAFYFGVTRKTICTDVEVLMTSFPVETVQGRYGCVRLIDSYAMFQGILNEEQQQTLIKIFPRLDKQESEVIFGLLRSNGSKRNKERIEGLI